MRNHILIGLKSGAMILAGGNDQDDNIDIKTVWLLKNDEWSIIGELKEVRKIECLIF